MDLERLEAIRHRISIGNPLSNDDARALLADRDKWEIETLTLEQTIDAATFDMEDDGYVTYRTDWIAEDCE